jgi:hypothetical protein
MDRDGCGTPCIRRLAILDSSVRSFSIARLTEGGGPLRHYRGYFLADDIIRAAESIEAADDGSVMLQAQELLLKSRFLASEVWHQSRLVGRQAIAPELEIIEGGA